MQVSRGALPAVLISVVVAVVLGVRAQQSTVAVSGQIDAGGPISLHVNFDKPLPTGANVRLEISPQATTQWIAFSTGNPDNPSRTSFTVKGTLPENAVPGTWTLRNVWLFLPGSIQGQSLGHNNATFQVKGREFPIPTTAEIVVTK